MGVKVHDRVRSAPFAHPETFAAGWNDCCAGTVKYGQSRDYMLGWTEALRLGAKRADAFNQVVVRQ